MGYGLLRTATPTPTLPRADVGEGVWCAVGFAASDGLKSVGYEDPTYGTA